ncbi:MAG TPA: HNH endonuclease signature motif containing protein [Nocardioides sp.]|uniref:HNH endonuclease signature motif containing protein n=1 Tax=Nocardioides sp. TaxID=35761 RepID=UPI002F4148EA
MTTSAAPVSPPVGFENLDPARVLACLAEAEAAERAAGRDKLQLALHWCLLHPATPESGVAVWGDAEIPGVGNWEESLGGVGCPTVAAFAPEPFAATLKVSTFAGMQVLADALDLAYRFPATWARVRRLEVAPWKARRLAQHTHHLSREAAAYVDAELASRIDSCGVRLIDRTIAHAAATYDPASQAEAEQTGKQAWDVRLLHRTDGGWAGTSHLDATGDTIDLSKFYDLVCDHATHLGRLGDTDPLGARKAKALGVIADAQAHLDLYGIPPATESTPATEDEAPRLRRPTLAKSRFYLHLSLADLLALPDPLVLTSTGDVRGVGGTGGVGEVERLGPATTVQIREWLGTTRATIVPVLDLARDDAVDEHDPPAWMRETVILRDRHCVFPWCSVDARGCDQDHITPYIPIDQGGPPGQTSPARLACLCRRHHNAKTSGRWRYHRTRDGTYTWHGPHGQTYLVTPTGTTPLPHA